jgi:hypothetical protein
MSNPVDDTKYRDFYKMMSQQQMIPVDAQAQNVPMVTRNAKSILRTTLQVYIGEPAWAFVGNPDEEDRLINMLRKAGIILTITYGGRKVLIELELK